MIISNKQGCTTSPKKRRTKWNYKMFVPNDLKNRLSLSTRIFLKPWDLKNTWEFGYSGFWLTFFPPSRCSKRAEGHSYLGYKRYRNVVPLSTTSFRCRNSSESFLFYSPRWPSYLRDLSAKDGSWRHRRTVRVAFVFLLANRPLLPSSSRRELRWSLCTV